MMIANRSLQDRYLLDMDHRNQAFVGIKKTIVIRCGDKRVSNERDRVSKAEG